MANQLTFNLKYFATAILLFIVEVLIALYAHDQIVRPYVGDFLVVMLIYCFVKAFLNFPILKTAIGVLLFSFLIEFLQYCNIIEKLGLQHSKFANTVMGNSFAWIDIATYIGGIAIVLLLEKIIHKKLS
jgi:hypothetical protein